MNPIVSVYTTILWRPLFNGLVLLYNILPLQDLGLAIIALTIAIRIIMLPFFWKGQRAQQDLQRIQPEMNRIKEQYKDDKEAQARALMELYKEHNVNPFSGCLILLIQFPILIALFSVFKNGLNPEQLSYLYQFVENPTVLDPISFGLVDLSKGNIYLGVFAAVTQYFQTKLMTTKQSPAVPSTESDFSAIFQKQALYLFPVIILITSMQFPAALSLYWTVLNILGIFQSIYMRRSVGRK